MLRDRLRNLPLDIVNEVIVVGESYDPEALSRLKEKLDCGFDAAFCSRYPPESGSDDDTIIRFIGNRVFDNLFRRLYGVNLSDSLFLYSIFKEEILPHFEMTTHQFDFCIEFPVRMKQAGFTFTKIPARERPRIADVSKVITFTDGFQIPWAMTRLKIFPKRRNLNPFFHLKTLVSV